MVLVWKRTNHVYQEGSCCKSLHVLLFSSIISTDVITPLSIYLSVMIVFFLTFDLFSSTPANEDGS